ncbi:hypothetical protein MMC07_002885 [Pseudocyphellaria aurata]|nr:hypothetical protein [Pseudocyphellaria aurata]
MIQLKTILNCVDNTGATLVECVGNLRMKRHAKIGDRIIVVVQKTRSFGENSPGGATAAAGASRVKRGDIKHAVVVRTRKKLQRKDGMVIRFDDNACALIGKNGDPLGTRINGRFAPIKPFRSVFHEILRRAMTRVVQGIVGSELRDKQWSKILSLAGMHA